MKLVLGALCFILATLIMVITSGCNESPFPNERPDYTIAFLIDRSLSYDDYMARTAFSHFTQAKNTLFRDMGGSESLIIVAVINGNGSEAVLFEGGPRAFAKRFPTKESFADFLNQTPLGSSPVYRSVAETTERLCRRHENHPSVRSLLLVYSDMDDNHGGKDEMDAAVRKYATYRSAIGVYGANEKWEGYFSQLGVKHCAAYDSKREDPPLPQSP